MTFRLSALRRRASPKLIPSARTPIDRKAFAESPEASAFSVSMQIAKRTNNSFSSLPSRLLHCKQLGTVHRWTFSGVVAGYQDFGKTWSRVGWTNACRQCTHRIGARGVESAAKGLPFLRPNFILGQCCCKNRLYLLMDLNSVLDFPTIVAKPLLRLQLLHG
jgi:hypothetical protein